MQKKILITDDDPGLQDIFKIIFERAGYLVILSTDAKCIFDNNFDHPDVILLDKQLSGIDGLDVCRHLKGNSETCSIPVIMVSATPGIALMATEAGAQGFVEKPFLMKDLLATVNHWANFHD